LKNFWPHRSKAEGFSIQNLARKYGLKIPRVSHSETSNQLLDDSNLLSVREEDKKISIVDLSNKRRHWANRDFSEYKEAA
tara:strand:+ start:417 stop:656 length:240 start_codon:yes stop_codon:yes gene_type:complete